MLELLELLEMIFLLGGQNDFSGTMHFQAGSKCLVLVGRVCLLINLLERNHLLI